MAKLKTLTNVTAVISALGGPARLGQRFNTSPQAFSNWSARGHIPPAWYFRIQPALKSEGYEAAPEVFGGVRVSA